MQTYHKKPFTLDRGDVTLTQPGNRLGACTRMQNGLSREIVKAGLGLGWVVGYLLLPSADDASVASFHAGLFRRWALALVVLVLALVLALLTQGYFSFRCNCGMVCMVHRYCTVHTRSTVPYKIRI
jgi:hypothetical protein